MATGDTTVGRSSKLKVCDMLYVIATSALDEADCLVTENCQTQGLGFTRSPHTRFLRTRRKKSLEGDAWHHSFEGTPKRNCTNGFESRPTELIYVTTFKLQNAWIEIIRPGRRPKPRDDRGNQKIIPLGKCLYFLPEPQRQGSLRWNFSLAWRVAVPSTPNPVSILRRCGAK
jgi:hypothetical protein